MEKSTEFHGGWLPQREIKAPPIHIDAELKKGDRGRVLVLLDAFSKDDTGIPRNDSETLWAESPIAPPSLNVQRKTLESLLTEAGWSYIIVTAKEDFVKQLHTGNYSTYLLLSKHIKLDESVQKELREAVYRGDGLIEAGSHDQRQGRIDDILGIKFLGKHPGVNGLSVLETDIYSQGRATFGLRDKMLKVNPQDAQVLGLFSNSFEPAMTAHQFGSGSADYFGYDLLAEISMTGADPLFSELLLGALDHVQSKDPEPVADSIYPLQLKLVNRGIHTLGQAVITLPSNVGVIDPGTAEWVDNTLIWPFELITDQTLLLDSWISLPESAVDLSALVQTGVSPNITHHVSAHLSLTPARHPTLSDLIADAEFLDAIKYKHVIKYLTWAKQDHADGNYSHALSSLIRASDSLIDLGAAADTDLRMHVAVAMRAVAKKM